MLRNVFLKSLRDHRRALMWWSIGLLLLAVEVIAFFPSVSKVPGLNEFAEQAPEALMRAFLGEFTEFTSPEGYLNGQLYFFMAPLLFMIFAIAFGSGATAKEEERGTLDLLLSNPLPRWRIVAEKFAAMVVGTLGLAFVLWAGVAVSAVVIDMDISAWRVAQATLSGALLALVFGALALAVGCLTGNRSLSIGVATAIGAATYFFNALAPLVESLEAWRRASPFYYFIAADPLKNGLDPGHVTVLVGLTVVFLVAALFAFGRRDLSS